MKGTGNLGLFSIPEIKFPAELEAFPPTDKFEKDTFRDDLTGTQSWEYILIPRNTGILKIPKIQLSFFNPKINYKNRFDNIIYIDPLGFRYFLA